MPSKYTVLQVLLRWLVLFPALGGVVALSDLHFIGLYFGDSVSFLAEATVILGMGTGLIMGAFFAVPLRDTSNLMIGICMGGGALLGGALLVAGSVPGTFIGSFVGMLVGFIVLRTITS